MPSSAERLAQTAVKYFAALQKPDELAELIRLVSDHIRPGQAIIELGCDAGGTLFVWRRLAGFVVGVDLPNGPFGTGRQLFDYGAAVVRGDSRDEKTLARVVQLLAGRPVGFLFIDADHTYQGVKADFELWGPMVAPGGLIALHDICEHNKPEVEVARFWRELRYQYRAREIIEPPKNWGGIGVVHVA